MWHRALAYAFLIFLSAALVVAAWALGRVNVLLALALVPIALFALTFVVQRLGLGAVNRTRQEVVNILQSYLDAADSSYDPSWEDFVSVPIRDPELDAVRQRLLQLESTHSRTRPEDFLQQWKAALRQALRELGSAAA
jgi:hypothetical protein